MGLSYFILMSDKYSPMRCNLGTEVAPLEQNETAFCSMFELPETATFRDFYDGCTNFGTGTKVAKGNTSPLATFVLSRYF